MNSHDLLVNSAFTRELIRFTREFCTFTREFSRFTREFGHYIQLVHLFA
ncbi:hypothetical protein QRD90_24290 [Peribacillus frigoritolerans]|nr:hypothetical protein [Peribacillus frigoritolerans]USK79956.1 hypothetical protein LHV56_24755 [Peribacillus frigoritolerans]WJE47242.1 hypothetical protein QRD90_24290 [Peribacillus frigoritolerans]